MSSSLAAHIRRESLSNLVINLLINGGLAYWLLHEHPAIFAWGENGYGPDLLLTGFLLSFIISAIFIWMHRAKRAKGVWPGLNSDEQGWARHLPTNTWLAAVCFGVIGLTVAAPVLLAVLWLAQIQSLTPLQYALLKGIWAGVLAALLVPAAIRLGLRQSS